jgi:double zinc ribbon protein
VIALIVGTFLAIGAMAWVLAPLFRPGANVVIAPTSPVRQDLAARRERAVEALREIEFDRATGKLADADYDMLKTRYTRQAVAAMRQESGAALVDESEIEAAIRRAREAQANVPACSIHGPRPEPDATYCSECGRFLRGACAHCGATIAAPGARFCEGCGHLLAA